MMNAAFAARRIRARYTAESLGTEELEPALRRYREERVSGLNVTIPFKKRIIPLLDELTPSAKAIGAVNTVKRTRNGYLGFNTDIEGVVKPLLRVRGGGSIKRAAVLGAGGAARAFVGAMNRLGCRHVYVVVREPSRARKFAEELGFAFPGLELELHKLSKKGMEGLSDIVVLFNATPIGSDGVALPREILALMDDHPIVFDAVYDPVETDLTRAAREKGCPVVPGYEMLLYQAEAAFEIWTGKPAPEAQMKSALLAALGV